MKFKLDSKIWLFNRNEHNGSAMVAMIDQNATIYSSEMQIPVVVLPNE